MEWNYHKKEKKEAEIRSTIETCLREAGLDETLIQTTAREFLENAIRVTPPEVSRVSLDMVTMAPSGRGGGRSSKAGNVKLNIRALFECASSGVFTVVSATQVTWALPFAAILLWNSIWRNMQVRISEIEAVTLWVMWQVKTQDLTVIEGDIRPAVDVHAKKYERQTLSDADIKYALRNLSKIGCIKPSKTGSDKWLLCERVSLEY